MPRLAAMNYLETDPRAPMLVFPQVLKNTSTPWRPAVPKAWLFLRLSFGVSSAGSSGCGRNTIPGNRKIVRRSKDGS